MSSDSHNQEEHHLFQNDPNFDPSILVKFPNGKTVPLSKINKPHSRIPGRLPLSNAEEKQAAEGIQTPAEASDVKDPFEGMTEDEIMVRFPNGKKVPLSKINKPHAVIHPRRQSGRSSPNTSGGLLHNGGHRPQV